MRAWVPVPGTTRGDLVLGALRAFADAGYEGVGVGELARAAGVTTGALYHHFGSKLGLYELVRDDVEQRALDRMEGAAQAREEEGRPAAVRAALLVAFDWATGHGMARLLAEPHPGRRPDHPDPLAAFLARAAPDSERDGAAALAAILLAAWRAALQATVDGLPASAVRAALATTLQPGDA